MGITIYVTYTYGPAFIQAVQNIYQTSSANQRENEAFREAMRQYARECGKTLNKGEQNEDCTMP